MVLARNTKARRSILIATISLSVFLTFVGGTCFQPHDKSRELRNPLLTPAIEARADDDGLEDLRAIVLKPDDIEVRIWSEPTNVMNVAEGYVLSRISANWTGRHLLPSETGPRVSSNGHIVTIQPHAAGEVKSIQVEPLNGWEFLWNSLTATGLLALPDESRLDLKADQRRGEGNNLYIVEIKTAEEYRAYRYTTPEHYSLPETKAMVQIVRTLSDEFSTDQKQ